MISRQVPLILAVAWCAVLFGVAAVVYAGPAKGNGPEPLQLVTDWKVVACNVEQQTFRWYGDFNISDPCPGPTVVNNPTPCPWDIDDSWSLFHRSGSIETGQTVTATYCAIADGTHRAPVDVSIRAKHALLAVSLSASDGRSWTAVPVRDGNEYHYFICADNLIQGTHPEVPDSNGGHGTRIDYVLTISAPVRGANGVTALFKYGDGIWTVGECEP